MEKDSLEIQRGYMHAVRDEVGGGGYYILTFGCQQNESDSEKLAGMAREMGYHPVERPDDAKLILVNTCAVREHAELKALSITGQLKHIKERDRSVMIGICGCMVTQEHRCADIKNKYPYVDFLFGTNMLSRFPEILYMTISKHKRQFYLDAEAPYEITEGLPVKRESAFQAWVTVMYGCNNFCSYCVVPYVRGRERSRRREDILAEISELAAEGYREITLLGQNVNSYGMDLYGEGAFPELIADIMKLDGDFILRFMTSHPKDASRRLIEVMAENPKCPGRPGVARALHLPLQSGSERLLKIMNRHYTPEDYCALIDYARSLMPDISISTDIIVGFPGETEADFQLTLDILERIRYDSLFSFIYSKREGTPAATMEDQIPDELKKERFERLLKLQGGIMLEKNRSYEGETFEALVEGISRTDSGRYTARTDGGRLIHFEADEDLTGRVIKLHIDHAETYALYGSICDKKL